MSESSRAKRSYNSTRRRLQARQTRRQILEAARALFTERGYDRATIEMIAQQAGVAQETVYAAFGSKQAILLDLVHVSVVGDEEPTPLLERPFITRAAQANDQREIIAQFADNIYQIMTRMSPIFALLRATAKTDVEIAALLAKILRDRMGGMGYFVAQLRRVGAIREPAPPEAADASAWVLSSAEVFDLLTRDLGWSETQYKAWLRDALERLYLLN